MGKTGDGFSPPHDFGNKCSPPPSRFGDMLPDPGEADPALLMTHHDALCDPWTGSEWVTTQQTPQPPHWLPSPADSEMGECSGKAPMIGGVPVADWTRACELLDGWFVPYWEGWTDTSQPPPPRQPRFKFLWASDDPHQTLAVLEAAQQAPTLVNWSQSTATPTCFWSTPTRLRLKWSGALPLTPATASAPLRVHRLQGGGSLWQGKGLAWLPPRCAVLHSGRRPGGGFQIGCHAGPAGCTGSSNPAQHLPTCSPGLQLAFPSSAGGGL